MMNEKNDRDYEIVLHPNQEDVSHGENQADDKRRRVSVIIVRSAGLFFLRGSVPP